MIENKLGQNQKTGDNCNNQQAGRDIYNGISEEELDKRIEEKWNAVGFPIQQQLSVFQQQLLSLQTNLIDKIGVAKQNQQSRCNIFEKTFMLKLLDESHSQKEKIFKAFEEPGMQEAFYKAQHGYVLSNDTDHLTILTKMLIDRGSLSQRTNKQMLIDDAIDILPKLNQKHLNILSFYLVIQFEYPTYDRSTVTQFIREIINCMKLIVPLQKDDYNLQYLCQKNCLVPLEFQHIKLLVDILEERTKLLNSGFPKEEYNNLIHVDIPEIIFEKSMLKPENTVINMSLHDLEHLLQSKNLPEETAHEIVNFWHRSKGENDHKLIKDFISENFDGGKLLFEYWENIMHYNLSILGKMLAWAHAKIKYPYNVHWDFE